MNIVLNIEEFLPQDNTTGALAARVWRPELGGPSVVAIRDDQIYDISINFATMRDLCEADDPASALRQCVGEYICKLTDLLANTPTDDRDNTKPWLLSPADLQCIKAAGVTFPISMLERVIDEKSRGNANEAAKFRLEINALVGGDLSKLQPGSEQAMALKEILIARDSWSQYLEVAIGPDAEIFTKAPVMATVGTGFDAGVHPASEWNNPEPEVVLTINSKGKVIGATLGNDVNLRDIEGRSALLLGKAKDNNASATMGPFIRFFDHTYSIEDLKSCTVTLNVTGDDGFSMDGLSSMAQISRDPLTLAADLVSPHHQYPDGAMLYLGTMFAPVKDRDKVGSGFTHKDNDIVKIYTPKLGTLVNRVRPTDKCDPWVFSCSHLMKNLAKRNLL